jgi:hypothetical protein
VSLRARGCVALLPIAALLVAVSACGSGGGLETGGLEPAAYFELFDGAWELDPASSGDIADQLESLGGGGGRGGGGRRGRGGGGNAPDPAAMRLVRELASAFPPTIVLAVSDSAVSQNVAGPGQLLLPLTGESIRVELAPGFNMNATARWDGPRLRIERTLPGVGRLVDTIEPVDGGGRLAVRRSITLGPRRVELRVNYDRVG